MTAVYSLGTNPGDKCKYRSSESRKLHICRRHAGKFDFAKRKQIDLKVVLCMIRVSQIVRLLKQKQCWPPSRPIRNQERKKLRLEDLPEMGNSRNLKIEVSNCGTSRQKFKRTLSRGSLQQIVYFSAPC